MPSPLPQSGGCYADFLGWCTGCDSRGCVCGLPGDAVDGAIWKGSCPVVPIILQSLYTIALLSSCVVAVRCMRTLVFQVQRARQLRQSAWTRRPVWVLVLMLAATCFNGGLCMLKLLNQNRLIGVDMLTSVWYWVMASLINFGASANIVDFVSVALGCQESTYGKRHIGDRVRAECFWTYLLTFAMVLVNAIPMANALAARMGRHERELQTSVAVLYNLSHGFLIGLLELRWVMRANDMIKSFNLSKAALQTKIPVSQSDELP